MEPLLGIIGGMGPLASAGFLATLYEHNLHGPEQFAPRCVLFSDPAVPDRTQAILDGRETPVLDFLESACRALSAMKAERFIFSCITAHHFIPRLSEEFRAKTISLLDVFADAIDDVNDANGHLLLLCTHGTRRSGVLARHPRWKELSERVVLPDAQDQDAIHALIYSRIKAGNAGRDALITLRSMAAAYGARGCIAACTDLHLLTRLWLRDPLLNESFEFRDPLLLFARQYRRYMHVEC